MNGRRLHARRRGQGLVEFIMVIPLLMLLLLGVYELSRVWNIYNVMTDAAREGCRTAVVFNPAITADSVRRVMNNAMARARIDTSAVSKTMPGFKGGSGTPTTCTLQYNHQLRLIDGLLQWTTGQSTFQLTTTFTMRNE